MEPVIRRPTVPSCKPALNPGTCRIRTILLTHRVPQLPRRLWHPMTALVCAASWPPGPRRPSRSAAPSRPSSMPSTANRARNSPLHADSPVGTTIGAAPPPRCPVVATEHPGAAPQYGPLAWATARSLARPLRPHRAEAPGSCLGRRKPRSSMWVTGPTQPPHPDRQSPALKSQLPPRMTR